MHWAQNSLSSYEQLAQGKTQTFSYIRRTAWHKAGGKLSKKPMSEFTEQLELKLTPLPHLEHLPVHKREAYLRRQVRELEFGFRESRKREEKTVPTKERLAKLDPFDKPKSPRKRRPQPLCHASSKAAADDFKKEWRVFLDWFYQASGKFLSGMYHVEFPQGSFRPPITTMYRAANL
jgi:hypothetical protein